jgi:hypothetical protein
MKIIGIMAFLLIGGTAGSEFLSLLTLPEVQTAAESSIPFLAGHFTTLTLVAGIVFALTVIAIPPDILSTERETDMANKDLSEIVRDGRKHGAEVKRVGDMAFDEMHQAVPMGAEKLEHMKTLRRDYSEKSKTR